jgi:restriction system protein
MSKDDKPIPAESQYTAARVIGDWERYVTQRDASVIKLNVHDDVDVLDSVNRQSVTLTPASATATASGVDPAVAETFSSIPEVLVQQTIVVYGDKSNEGQLVRYAPIPFLEILKQLNRNPNFLYQIPWRNLEELIAAAWDKAGCSEVTLTPRSNDGGRDVIAVWHGIGKIRMIDQVKAFHPGHRVGANDVRATLGVILGDPAVTKGCVTTTSTFAPGIEKDPIIAPHIPYKLELRNGEHLLEWLKSLSAADS